MRYFDLFNGDADGIFALLQLRKRFPVASEKLSGVKRDISLLSRCKAQQGDMVTVLDLSMHKNSEALKSLLELGVKVDYLDHHKACDDLHHPLLTRHINLDANTCTSLIVDNLVQGQYRAFAVAGAFGDNLVQPADALCEQMGYSPQQRDFLLELGTLVNYNAYGETRQDLHIQPEMLFESLSAYQSPFDLAADPASCYFLLKAAYRQDMRRVQHIQPIYSDAQLEVVLLPNSAFSRRVSGALGNQLANAKPNKAHLVLTETQQQGYRVSLRAPLNNKQGAEVICSAYATGGGRAGAAGINLLPQNNLERLIAHTSRFYLSTVAQKAPE